MFLLFKIRLKFKINEVLKINKTKLILNNNNKQKKIKETINTYTKELIKFFFQDLAASMVGCRNEMCEGKHEAPLSGNIRVAKGQSDKSSGAESVHVSRST